MTLAGIRACALDVLQSLGTTCTLQSITSASMTAAGAVSETVTSETATSSDLLDERQQMDPDSNGSQTFGVFYLAASGLSATPEPGDRVVYQSRNFLVSSVLPMSGYGGVVAWRLDVYELGSA